MDSLKNYFNYSLHQRINRKSHLGHDYCADCLISCTHNPEYYMQPEHLELSGQIYMEGESIRNKTHHATYKVLFANGDFNFRRTNRLSNS